MYGRLTSKGRGLNPQNVRVANRALVLQLLRRYRQLSRADIARRSGLSQGTVSRIVAELTKERLVTDHGAANSTGGRPGTLLRLDSEHLYSVGVEIQNWETRVAVGAINGQTVGSHSFRTPGRPLRALDLIAEVFASYRDRYGADRVEGLGVSVRGIVDSETGVVQVGNAPEWNRVPVRDYLQQNLGAPVYVENNIRVAALAEFSAGNLEAHASQCLLHVRVDEGVGMAIVLGGSIHRGPHMAAGEFGQMVICESPGEGRHDRAGCLESLSSNSAISNRYAELSGLDWKNAGETASRTRSICHLAMEGDAAAGQAILEASRWLGIGISNVIWGLDADMVVIDGVITEAWPIVSAAIREQFPRERELPNFTHLILRPCAFHGDASLLGAAALPFASIFNSGRRTSNGTRSSRAAQ